jgi:hypothetical protein
MPIGCGKEALDRVLLSWRQSIGAVTALQDMITGTIQSTTASKKVIL